MAKKIFSICMFILLLQSVTIFAQSNVTMIMKERIGESYFNRTEFSYCISGLETAADASSFLMKMKGNKDVASAKETGKDNLGNMIFAITMKNVFDKKYYLDWATTLGISHIVTVRGEKRTPQELLETEKHAH